MVARGAPVTSFRMHRHHAELAAAACNGFSRLHADIVSLFGKACSRGRKVSCR
jgi:hypothetical protein